MPEVCASCGGLGVKKCGEVLSSKPASICQEFVCHQCAHFPIFLPHDPDTSPKHVTLEHRKALVEAHLKAYTAKQ